MRPTRCSNRRYFRKSEPPTIPFAESRCLVKHAPTEALPPGVRAVDYDIRGMHLAYDLLDGVDALVIVDALPGTDPPGTIRDAK